MSFKRIVGARSVLQSIREGLSRDRLMEKHCLSPACLDNVLHHIQVERDRRARLIVEDFLSGMTVRDIATRNGFPVERFLDILRLVLSLQIRQPADSSPEAIPIEFQDADRERRRYPRIQCPVLTGHVRDVAGQGRAGTILDISEKGVAIRGIFAKVEDEIILLMGERDCELPDPVVLKCLCRWVDDEHPAFGQSAGFEITEISETDEKYLKSLLEAEERLSTSQQFLGS